MKVLSTAILTILPLLYTWGQDLITSDPQKIGSQYAMVHVDVKGTPFLTDEWESGTVQLANGTELTDIELKYHVADDIPLYRTEDDRIWEFISPVQSFTLGDGTTFKKSVGGFYQVLEEGKYNLYKRHVKAIFEQRPYGSSNVEKRFRDNVEYYAGSLESPVRIRINRSSLSKYFHEEQERFKEIMKSNRLKTEADLLELFQAMNTP